MWRVLALGLTALALTGCGEGKRAELAKCGLEARQMYPHTDQQSNNMDVQVATQLCMEAQGWVSDFAAEKCRESILQAGTTDCYRRRTWTEITNSWFGVD